MGNRRVRFVSCSATIANPVEHMQTIFGVDDVLLIDEDGSPCGQKVGLIALSFVFPRLKAMRMLTTSVGAHRSTWYGTRPISMTLIESKAASRPSPRRVESSAS